MPFFFLIVLWWALTGAAHAAVLDSLGHAIPARPYHRIVSLAPSNTELVYALGWGDRLVGVTDRCDYPPDARQKPKVGGADNLSVERILALKPDLILTIPSKSAAVNQLARMGRAPVLSLPGDRLDSVARNAETLGALLGPQGARFAQRFRAQLAAIAPSRKHPRVFYMVWDQPLMSAGPGTFLDDLIAHAGGTNVVRAAGYPMYSEERLMEDRPEVVLYPDNLAPGAARMRSRLPHARFVSLPANEVSRPGPRILPVIRTLSRTFDAPR